MSEIKRVYIFGEPAYMADDVEPIIKRNAELESELARLMYERERMVPNA